MSVPTTIRRDRLSVTSVRPARPEDLERLQEVEAAADRRFAEHFDVSGWPAPPTGAERAGERGFVLVVGQPVVGFAHVIELGPESRPHLHLEQLSVHPDSGGQGLGTMLLLAALGIGLDRGYGAITLMTYADIPWNAPWYAKHGFRELDLPASEGPSRDDAAELLYPLRRTEQQQGLDHHGRRVAMIRPLVEEPAPIPAVSVIPLRDGPSGLEAFVQHRVATMDFAPGAVVFPGGRVDAADAASAGTMALPADVVTAHGRRWRHTPYGGPDAAAGRRVRTLLATGVRELAEETGVVVAPRRLVPWDSWVTPIGYGKRFDVAFFVLPVERDTLAHTTTEASGSEWLPINDLVSRAEAGELALVPPTRTIVDELQRLGSVEAVLALQPVIESVRHDVTPLRPRRSESTVGGQR
ncbi:MAG TPA: GNAT family N-acetyltransferase [Intrasporangium sp.]|nr:GNAT family N-acetyltransferase [Intrasporangium sp.]